MKESDFIDLLNLYLDNEISPEDAARLEAEVQANPARRRLYQQYCRMHKACSLVAADFTTNPEKGTQRNVVAFEPSGAGGTRRRSGLFLSAGAVAAAACLALLFVLRGERGAQPAPNAVGGEPFAVSQMPVPAAVASQVAVATPGPRHLGSAALRQKSSLVADPLLLTGSRHDALLAAGGDNAVVEPLKWISSLQIQPLPTRVAAEELRFDRPAALGPDARGLNGSRVPAEANVEMTAFRFVK